MPVFKQRSVLSGITVKEAMQRQVVQLDSAVSIRQYVRHIIKYKANAVLATQAGQDPAGVVSKTDIMGAYYAGLPVETGIGDIMVGPPDTCLSTDTVEDAIDRMQTRKIHQLYVRPEPDGPIVGQIEYSDIVGLLYRYCRTCTQGQRQPDGKADADMTRLSVKDVMSFDVAACNPAESISQVMDVLSEHQLGAVLISSSDEAVGIISKTDLAVSYVKEIRIDTPAREIMKQPVVSCHSDTLLSEAIQQMFLFDIQRIFVKTDPGQGIKGILSLSDATRFRSGTCRVCGAGRLLDNPGI